VSRHDSFFIRTLLKEKKMSKVVPFSRSAAYLYQRAVINRREGHLLDALELNRRALEKDPDNVDYELDLAQVLCELGCYVQSNRILTRMLARDSSLSECYFGLASNFYGMNDADSAYKALMCFLAEDPQSAGRQEVGELLHNLFVARTQGGQKSRRKARAAKLSAQGVALMRSGDLPGAEQALKRSLQIRSRHSETRAILAMCLAARGDMDGAVREVARSLRPTRPPLRALCIAAQIENATGNPEAAAKLMDHAAARNPEGGELRILLDAACDLKMDERVHELAEKALAESPYDQTLLHLCAAAIVNTGRPQERAARCWARIRRLQPDNEIASYYLAHSDRKPIAYAYRLPDDEIRARAEILAEAARSDPDGVQAAWEQSAKLRRVVRWAVESGDPAFLRAGVHLLAAVETREAEWLLRQVMVEPSAPQAVKHQALMLLGLRGAKPPFLMTGEDKFSLASAMDSGQLPRLPLAYRRVLKRAVYTGISLKEDYPARLTMLWLRYASALGDSLPALKDLNGWAAALNLCLARIDQLDVSLDELAELFRCSRRKMEHMARRIERLAPLEQKEAEHESD
jgi:tetratricopeptide (TPR) repeat protein